MRRLLIPLLCAILALPSLAAGPSNDDEPEPDWKVFDWDRDPSSPPVVNMMLGLAAIGKNDILYDLGSGDGRIAITAAKKFGIRTVGIEFNGQLVPLSRQNAQKAGVTDKVVFIEGDVFQQDFSEATVIAIALWESINVRLRPRFLAMPPGTRIVSNEHEMGEWKPDKTVFVDSRTSWGYRPVHLWVVPAPIDGAWRLTLRGQEATMKVEQKFQNFSGQAQFADGTSTVRNGKIRGRTLTFELVRRATVTRLSGTVQDDGAIVGADWRAVREPPR